MSRCCNHCSETIPLNSMTGLCVKCEPRNPSSEAGLSESKVREIVIRQKWIRTGGTYALAEVPLDENDERLIAALAKEARDAATDTGTRLEEKVSIKPQSTDEPRGQSSTFARIVKWPLLTDNQREALDIVISTGDRNALYEHIDWLLEQATTNDELQEARDAGPREEPISGVEFNLRYGHQATCVFGLENSGMCDCGKGFSGAARDAAQDEGE